MIAQISRHFSSILCIFRQQKREERARERDREIFLYKDKALSNVRVSLLKLWQLVTKHSNRNNNKITHTHNIIPYHERLI